MSRPASVQMLFDARDRVQRLGLRPVEVREMVAYIEQLEQAVKPFAELGTLFLPAFSGDDSPFAKTPDKTVIQIGAAPLAGWSVTVEDFRRAGRFAPE